MKNGPTHLQEVIHEALLTRDMGTVSRLFAETEVPFWNMLSERCFSAVSAGGDFRVLDLGCGSGACIEEAIRNLKIIYNNYQERIFALGVDHSILDDKIPARIRSLTGKPRIFNFGADRKQEPMIDGGLHTKFIEGDARNLPVADSSVDFGYSVGTLIYIGDTLKCLEEMYRVLKPGGIFINDICAKEMTIDPPFLQMLEDTPGAKQIFEYRQSPYDPRTGIVICSKPAEPEEFKFPYSLKGVFTREEAFKETLNDHRDHYRNAVYELIGEKKSSE